MAGRFLWLTVAILVLSVVYMPMGAAAAPPEFIRVGLRFGTTATFSVQISFDDNIEFGYDPGDGFKSIYSYTGKGSIYVFEDSCFVYKNGTPVEVGAEDKAVSGTVFGPYHLQIADVFKDLQQAEQVLRDISDMEVEGYLAFDKGWRVWVGRYLSAGDMNGQREHIKNKLGGLYDIYPVNPSEERLQLNDSSGKVIFMFEGSNSFLVSRPREGDFLRVDGKRYRGDIEFKRQRSGNITVVNSLPLEHYLYGVVPKEVSPGWHKEVLKAQAVAARNFAAVNLNKHGEFGFDLCSGTDCQVYGGLDSENRLTNDAVDETKGQMIYHEGRPITAFYHASSGGHTENSENVWSISLPYIKAVDDSFDAGSPHDNWQRVYTNSQISSILAKHGMDIGSIQDMKVDSYTPAGRSLALTIRGSGGSTVLEKERSRAIFGYNDLKSTFFTVETDADFFVLNGVGKPLSQVSAVDAKALSVAGTKELKEGPDYLIVSNGRDYATVNKYPTQFIFNGRGWGHGLGMSQWGAKGMAEAGYSYMEILQYYYKDCVVQ